MLQSSLRPVRHARPAMTNSTIEMVYYGRSGTPYRCICGKYVFPESIWRPVVYVRTNKNTQGSQSWCYHQDCLKRWLESKIPVECHDSIPGITFRIAKNDRRTCLISKKSITTGTPCLLLQKRNNLQEVAVTLELFEKFLDTRPSFYSLTEDMVGFDYVFSKRNDLAALKDRAEHLSVSSEALLEIGDQFNSNLEIANAEYQKIASDPLKAWYFFRTITMDRTYFTPSQGFQEYTWTTLLSRMERLINWSELMKGFALKGSKQSSFKTDRQFEKIGRLDQANPEYFNRLRHSITSVIGKFLDEDFPFRFNLDGSALPSVWEVIEIVDKMIEYRISGCSIGDMDWSAEMTSKSGFLRQFGKQMTELAQERSYEQKSL